MIDGKAATWTDYPRQKVTSFTQSSLPQYEKDEAGDPKPAQDIPHADVGRAIEHIMNGKITKPVRDLVRKALDAADGDRGRISQNEC